MGRWADGCLSVGGWVVGWKGGWEDGGWVAGLVGGWVGGWMGGGLGGAACAKEPLFPSTGGSDEAPSCPVLS